MEATDRAVIRLTEAHTEHEDGRAVEWPALIDWLDKAVTEQVKRGQAGSGGAGSPIDMGALDLLQRIEREVRLMREALYLPVIKDTKLAIRDAWDTARAYRRTGSLDDDQQWERISEAPLQWVELISQEWDDRTRMMEVTVPCPSCGERWILEDVNGEEKRRAAVVVEYAEGRAPAAECRAADCGGFWVGWADVARLGFTLGAQQNLEILKACGIDLGDTIAETLLSRQ